MEQPLAAVSHGRQSDECLLALARDGQDSAFTAIVERYRPQLLAFARRLSHDGRAEDLVQQAFLQAFAALRGGTEVAHLSGWLHQIVRHAAFATSARARPEAPLDLDSPPARCVVDPADARLLAVSALEAVAELPERQRDAFVGTAIQGRSRAEVARAMGLSEGAVRQLVRRARLRVRSAVAVLMPYPLTGWLNALRDSGGPGLAAGAGAASAGGVALKLAAVVAAGVVAAGALSTTSHNAGLIRARAPRHTTSHPNSRSTPTRTGPAAPASIATEITTGPPAQQARTHAQADRAQRGHRHRGEPRGRTGSRSGQQASDGRPSQLIADRAGGDDSSGERSAGGPADSGDGAAGGQGPGPSDDPPHSGSSGAPTTEGQQQGRGSNATEGDGDLEASGSPGGPGGPGVAGGGDDGTGGDHGIHGSTPSVITAAASGSGGPAAQSTTDAAAAPAASASTDAEAQRASDSQAQPSGGPSGSGGGSGSDAGLTADGGASSDGGSNSHGSPGSSDG